MHQTRDLCPGYVFILGFVCMCGACVCAWTVHANIRLQEPQDIRCPHLIRFHLFLLSQGPSLILWGDRVGNGSDSWQLWGILCGEIKPKSSLRHGEWKVFNGWTVCGGIGNCVSIKVLTMRSLLLATDQVCQPCFHY